MALVVSDSSTLILMAKSNLLDCSLDYFGRIVIPKAVEKEVVLDGLDRLFEDALLVRQRISEEKIKVVNVENKSSLLLQTQYGLHAGEAEAIVCYSSLNADLLGVDDGKAIKTCRILGVKFFTALSLLIFFAQEKAFSKQEAEATLEELGKYGRYSQDELDLAFREIRGVEK